MECQDIHQNNSQKDGGKYVPEMIGVIEAPINKMMKAYPDEFSFMRHTTRRDRDLEKKGKS